MLAALGVLTALVIIGLIFIEDNIVKIGLDIKRLSEDIKELKALKCEDYKRAQMRIFMEYDHEIEQVLGKALGYPTYPIHKGMDHSKDPSEPTDKPDSGWVCVGDNTGLSLADEAAERIQKLEEKCQSLQGS